MVKGWEMIVFLNEMKVNVSKTVNISQDLVFITNTLW